MAYLQEASRKATTVATLRAMRERGEKIAMLTCYDASFAAVLTRAGVDALLVGDSLGNVLQGHDTTLPVTLTDMAYHTACVARGLRQAGGGPLLIADLPFGTYAAPAQALDSAVTLMQAGAQMIKIEGGTWLAPTVALLVQQGIPVCAHLGLTPQSVHALGGFKVQGKTNDAAHQLIEDAKALEQAGAALLVLEAIPSGLAAQTTAALTVPTIGIGAGIDCSGQVLVLHDALGVFPGRTAKFVKNFMAGAESIEAAVIAYVREVKQGAFPTAAHSF